MPNVKPSETALRCLFVSAAIAAVTNFLPAQAQYQTAGPTNQLTNADAPLFTQPNHWQDQRQHSYFAGDYRNAITTSVGYNNTQLFYYDDPIIQTVSSGPSPLPYNDVPNSNPVTTVNGSVPGLVTSAAVAGAVVGASALSSVGSSIGSTAGSTAASGTSTNVNGSVLDGTSF